MSSSELSPPWPPGVSDYLFWVKYPPCVLEASDSLSDSPARTKWNGSRLPLRNQEREGVLGRQKL